MLNRYTHQHHGTASTNQDPRIPHRIQSALLAPPLAPFHTTQIMSICVKLRVQKITPATLRSKTNANDWCSDHRNNVDSPVPVHSKCLVCICHYVTGFVADRSDVAPQASARDQLSAWSRKSTPVQRAPSLRLVRSSKSSCSHIYHIQQR